MFRPAGIGAEKGAELAAEAVDQLATGQALGNRAAAHPSSGGHEISAFPAAHWIHFGTRSQCRLAENPDGSAFGSGRAVWACACGIVCLWDKGDTAKRHLHKQCAKQVDHFWTNLSDQSR
jgi:hypothetical protein